MKKGFKQLKGLRVMITLPKREESNIKLSPEIQQEIDREFWEKCTKLKVYAVGENVEGVSEGDDVYIPPMELKRGDFIEIEGETKLIVNYLAISLVW